LSTATNEAPQLLESCFEALGGKQGAGHGLFYGKTSLDSLEWLQTPGLWGKSPSDNCYWTQETLPPCSQRLLDAIAEIIQDAHSHLDIAALEPFADGPFEKMLAASLSKLGCTGREVTVRILYGSHPFTTETPEKLEGWMSRITSSIDCNSRLHITAGRMASFKEGLKCSFNHAKIVAADGRKVVLGGHNFWSADYFAFGPAHDLSASIEGEAPIRAHLYLNHLWAWIGENTQKTKPEAASFTVGWEKGRLTPGAMAKPAPEFPSRTGKIPALFLSRYGTGIFPESSNPNLAIRGAVAAFRAAQRSIFISHMDLAFHYKGISYWPDVVFVALADALTDPARQLDIRVVLSQPEGRSGSGGIYSWGETLDGVLQKLRSVVGARPLSGSFRLAPIRFSFLGDVWQDGDRVCKITNHSKTWVVDESLFYIGSDNLYPHNLQEFGYVIQSEALVARWMAYYWLRLWQYSSPATLRL
jgi:hypothetical protein